MIKSRGNGGTLLIGIKELDPYIEVIPTNTPAFLLIILRMPGLKTSVHIALYMPTHSKESEFVSDLAELRNCLDNLTERFDPIFYIRGDGNVNPNNTARTVLLKQLLKDYNLVRTEVGHKTYHHFVGNGLYDSDIDVILHTAEDNVNETVTKVICKLDNPALLSHHDMIISSFTVPTQPVIQPCVPLEIAPKVDYTRTRILWSEHGQQEYCELVEPHLRQAREHWLDSSSQQSMSVLLSVTNEILTKCATLTNEFKVVGVRRTTRSRNIPKAIRLATNKLIKAHKVIKKHENPKSKSGATRAGDTFACTRKKYRQTVRQHRLKDSLSRYHRLDDIFINPTSAYSYIRSCRKSNP